MYKSIARKFIFPLLLKTRLPILLAKNATKRYLILNYHGVVSNVDLSKSKNHMSVQDFEQQIQFFVKHFDVLKQSDFLSSIRSGVKPDRPTLLLTFDDGYENNYTNAYSVLKKMKVPATIFPVTGLIGTKNATWYDIFDLTKSQFNSELSKKKLLNLASEYELLINNRLEFDVIKQKLKSSDTKKKSAFLEKYLTLLEIDIFKNEEYFEYWKILSENQMQEMKESGLITFGSHTVNHPNLDTICESEIQLELTDSKNRLEKILGETIDSIAFPDGAYNDKVKQIAHVAGYDTLFAVNHRCESDNDDSSLYQRLSISNSTTTESVLFYICHSFNSAGIS